MHVPGPQGCPERVGFLSHESPSQLTSLQLVPRLEAEGQQDWSPVPKSQPGLAWDCGLGQPRKWPSIWVPSAPLPPSPAAAGESGAQHVQPVGLLIPLNTHCAGRALCSWQP